MKRKEELKILIRSLSYDVSRYYDDNINDTIGFIKNYKSIVELQTMLSDYIKEYNSL